MSDDGLYDDPFVDDYEETTMEIVVETLTGTTFEMSVAPDETIVSIKNKIQRVEGILVSQQHLLYRLKELANDERLCDLGITAGATLRLVLSMRGGPISTRRLTANDSSLAWKELRDYVDSSREDVEKLPPGSKVTVLLLREGDNINLIRVIENEDGSCYPYSDSTVPRQVPRENPQSKYHEKSTENNLMMHKVIELRKKMEGLSLRKQAKKPPENKNLNDDIQLPSTSHYRLVDDSSLHNQEDETSVKFFGDGDIRNVYSDHFLLLDQRRATKTGRSHRPHRLDSTNSKAETPRSCTSIQTPSISILEEPESSMNKKDSEYAPSSPISVASGDANTVTMSQIPSLPSTSRNLLHLAHMPHIMLQEHTDRPKTSPEKYDPKAQEFCNVVFNDAAERSHTHTHHNSVQLSVNRRQSLDFSNKTNLPRMQFASNSNSRINNVEHQSQNNEWSQTFSTASTSTNRSYNKSNSNLLTSQYASTSKLNSAHLDSVLGNRVDSNNVKYNNERRSPLYGRRARIERIRNNMLENANLNPEKYGYSNLGYIANIEKIQNDAVPITKQPTRQFNNRRNLNFVTNLEPRNNCDPTSYELKSFKLPRRRSNMDQDNNTNNNTNTNTSKTHDTQPSSSCSSNYSSTSTTLSRNDGTATYSTNKKTNTQSLPPIIQKKSNRTRCAYCNKRLNITTIHTCRCGGIFCSQHRYSEVHGCHYDYKTEGRKILEQANPLVAAPKLPKI